MCDSVIHMGEVAIFFEKQIGFDCLRILAASEPEARIHAITSTENSASFPSLTAYCSEKKIRLLVIDSPNDEGFLHRLRESEVKLAFAVSYSRIFKSQIIRLLSGGIFNLHPAYLPRQRGCFPTMWSIIEGDQYAGYTLHRIDDGIDTGPLIAQVRIPITESDTGESLYAKQVFYGRRLFAEWACRILRGDFSYLEFSGGGCYHNKDLPFGGAVPWRESYEVIERTIRAFTHSNFPGLKAVVDGEEIEVIGIERAMNHGLSKVGDWKVDGTSIYFRCKDQTVKVAYIK